MSMQTYPIRIPAAFLITKETAVLINLKAAADTRPVEEIGPDEMEDLADENLAGENLENFGVTNVSCNSEFEGSAVSILDRKLQLDKPKEIEFNDETLVYVPCDNDASLFETAYKDFDALVAEFREKLRDVLPEDFAIEKHIYAITGTYFA